MVLIDSYKELLKKRRDQVFLRLFYVEASGFNASFTELLSI